MESNENTQHDPSFCFGPYIVLGDNSTYDLADDAVIAILTQAGQDHLSDAMDFDAVHDDDAIYIKLSDLIAAYNQVHGTTL
jgi:hypothetical protein